MIKIIKLKGFNPIKIKIKKCRNTWHVENKALNIFESGYSLKKVIKEIKEHIVYYYNHYSTIDLDKIMGYAAELKNLYKNLKRNKL